MERYLRTLQEVISSGDSSLQLNYYMPQIEAAMRQHYPGYVRPEHWNDTVAAAATTQLNVQTGLLNTVREELRPEDDLRLESLLDTLRLKTELAAGNLDVQQTGNYLTILSIQEQRRTRHMVGALTNALTTRFAHNINEVAQPEAALRLWLETAQVETLPYSGVGGVRTLDPIP
jgi:conjugal transfer/entry exclusion protein